MSRIAGVGYDASLLPWLAQAESGNPDAQSILASRAASESPIAGPDSQAATSDGATDASTDLENRVRAAVLAALQGAEQSGGPTDLKSVIYNTLVQVLKDHGIDPKTLHKTDGGGAGGTSESQPQAAQPVDAQSRALLAQILAGLSSVPDSLLAKMMPSPDGSQSLLDGSQGSSDLSSLLSTSRKSSQASDALLAQLQGFQGNKAGPLGFLFDSTQ